MHTIGRQTDLLGDVQRPGSRNHIKGQVHLLAPCPTFADSLCTHQGSFGISWPDSPGNITIALAKTYMEPVEVYLRVYTGPIRVALTGY